MNSQGISSVRNLEELRAQKNTLLDNELILLPAFTCVPAVESKISEPRPLDIWLNTFLPEDGYNWSITTEDKLTFRPRTIQHAYDLTGSSYKAALFFNSFRQSKHPTSNGYARSMEQMEAVRKHAREKGCYADALFAELIRISHPNACILFEKFVFLSANTNNLSLNLTPKVHTDRDYGPFESAIASFSSATDRSTGTVAYPLARVEKDMELSEWFNSERFGKIARSSTPYSARNGELMVFSGRQGSYHDDDTPRGLPHVSPALSEGDFRLVLLCRICYNLPQ